MSASAPSDLPWPYPPHEGPWSTQPTWECPGGTCECHPVAEEESKDEHVIVFYDPQGKRMPGARCRVYEQGQLITPEPTTTDGAGEVRVEIRATTCILRVEWAPAHMPDHQFLPYRKTYHVKMSDDRDLRVVRRLSNLGFSRARRRDDNVRAYQRAYGREPTGNLDDIRLEVLERHDGGAVQVFHPQTAGERTAAPSPVTRSFFGSPLPDTAREGEASPGERSPAVERAAFTQDEPLGGGGGGGGGGGTTTSGQNLQGSAVPDASDMILLVAIEPDFPSLLAVKKLELTLRPVNVPGMTAEQLETPVKPTVPPAPWNGHPGHLAYGFKDLPLGIYDALLYVEGVPRAIGKGTTYAMGHARVEIQMGLLTLAYVGGERQRPVLTVDDPLLDLDVPPMKRRRKVLAAIHNIFPMSKDYQAAANGILPPYGQGEYKRMYYGGIIDGKHENTCAAVNGGVMQRASGVGMGTDIKNHPSFVRYEEGLAPSVGDTVYYGTEDKFAHIGIIVWSSPESGVNWIAADGGQPDRTSEFKKGSDGEWGRYWHKPDYTGSSHESAWLLPRHFVIRGGEGHAVHGWATPVPHANSHAYPILGWSDVTHPDRPFPALEYDANGTEADYRACKILVRKVRDKALEDQEQCRKDKIAAEAWGS